ncbi:hypothetical protein [Streptomyces bullii]|uniref:Uncharacterized protein n=1 Tax=Streptomyces bullii TaxID=349910 RepID=A0ABW0UPK4_9ACTN
MPRHAGGRSRDPRRVRLLALAGAVTACAVALPLAVASEGSVRQGNGAAVRQAAERGAAVGEPVRTSPYDDGKAPSAAPAGSPLPFDADLATAVRCGPALTSPDGIEAQTCVMAQAQDVWARTYYRNLTGDALEAALSLMGPGGRSLRMHCAVGAGDEPGMCETPRERTRGEPAAYTAVAEFADRAGRGPLRLRSGSDGGDRNDGDDGSDATNSAARPGS